MFTRALNTQNVVKMGSLATQVNKTVEVTGNGLSMDVGLSQNKPIGQVIESTHPKTVPKLFTPFTIREQTFPNRILVAPMCMYSCKNQDGILTDFHLAHYGTLGIRGTSLVIIEATAVEPQGRLSPEDTGMWGDEHIEPLRRIARLVHASGGRLGIQLAHGGRKAACYPPYHKYEENGGRLNRGSPVPDSEGGFANEIRAPTNVAWSKDMPAPKELTTAEVKELVQKFADAARRSVEAGVDVIEIHGAHGYLIHEFLSGFTNKRTDEYGGSLDNRLRFVLEIIKAVRAVIPAGMPLFLRVSGTDYKNPSDMLASDPEGWDIDQVIELCRRAVPLGLDLIDISSGGNVPGNRGIFSNDFGYQVPLAQKVKEANIEGLLVGTVGGQNIPKLSEKVLQENKADVVLIARKFIEDPSYVYTAARELGVVARWPKQYSWWQPFTAEEKTTLEHK
ncbi:hypothetical protein HA402_010472 [Bradysia odoriphaga]|nr:hypothetical protein HA402_010472 [Bradysia odoriphaga]